MLLNLKDLVKNFMIKNSNKTIAIVTIKINPIKYLNIVNAIEILLIAHANIINKKMLRSFIIYLATTTFAGLKTLSLNK